MTGKDNYQLLIEKLDQFIRKYYVNQLIRGSLYSVALLLVLFLGLNFLEYQFYFDPGVKTTMFWSFVGISGAALFFWVVSPLLHYFNLGKIISHEQAANIIGNHFENVKDKLLNVLQLRNQADSSVNRDLILASINQKSDKIKLVPFKTAIDLSQNRKYLRYALPPLLLLLILLFAAPSLIKDSTARLVNFNKEFEKPAPFHFRVAQEDLTVVQFEDYVLNVEVEGEVLPNEVFIDFDNYQYRLSKEADNTFSYRFSNVQKETEFKLFSSGVESTDFTLEVLKKPNIMGFEISLDYPAYTQRKDEKLNSIGDIVVPVGTNLDWVFNSQNTDDISIKFSNIADLKPAKRFSDELFTYKKRAMKDETYKLYVSNEALPNADSISYTITTIPDLYPTIKAEKFQDSLNAKFLFFVGEAADDYGLENLSFNYQITDEKGEQGDLLSKLVENPSGKQTQYTYSWDLNDLTLKPGDEVTYYFEVFDNDKVNGSKSARTNLMVYNMPTVEEFEEMAEENDDEIKERLEKAVEESKKIQDEMKKQREKLLQEKELDWQQRKDLENLLERQKNLEKEIEQAKQAFEENIKNQEEFTETEERIMEKQDQLNEMFEELMSEEMKELMQQIEELLQEMQKEEALEKMEEFEFNDEELEMNLDRMLELFKQMEMEHEMEDFIDKMEELAEEQEELSEETKDADEKSDEMSEEEKQKKQEELEKKQEELNEKFDDLKEKMEDIEKKNEELENKKELGDPEEQMEDIEKEMDESQEQLQQEQNKKASKKQKSASEKMREMAMGMQMQMQSQAMEQMEEDMQSLRQLLENLVGLSFEQEDLMDQFVDATRNTPRYVELSQVQHKLKDDFRLIEDSLQALSKRVFQIESFVTEKVTDIKSNMAKTLKLLEGQFEEFNTQPGAVIRPRPDEYQQRTMKNTNDLALMLSEVMQQMQQQMSGMMAGNQMCDNPGGKGGKPGSKPSDKSSQGQKGLNEQMKKMKEGLEKGQGGTSKEFAKMAAKQAALRQALKEKQKELQGQGQGSKDLEKLLEQMNKTETDLVNKRLTNEMMKRQQDILTRLLEHEKAERQREYDNKRKSKTAGEYDRKVPPSLEEYIKKREAEIDIYKTVSPSLKPYYKFLVEEYFKSLKSD